MRRFDESDAAYFFGRDRLTAALLEKLTDHLSVPHPLAVLGATATGKSSLLRAGLLPALRRGTLSVPGFDSCLPIIMTPGEHPMWALSLSLTQIANLSPEEISAGLAADPNKIADIVARACLHQESRATRADTCAVLIVDQFEELFTLCSDEGERRLFVQTLSAAASSRIEGRSEIPTPVIFGLRTDFFGHCASYPELASALTERPLLVDSMNDDELRAVIEGPAALTGIAFQDGLTDLLLSDLAAGEPAGVESGCALLLLAYVLREVWDHRNERLLTITTYAATGGIWHAIAQHAEQVYDDLGNSIGASAQHATRLLFSHLLRAGNGTGDVRHRISFVELVRDRSAEEGRAIVAARDAFADPRTGFITITEECVEITHESLGWAWPRLRHWIDEDRRSSAHDRFAAGAETSNPQDSEAPKTAQISSAGDASS
ncbi:ATP-binding protein, partial [Frankia sp. Cas8]|uniref:ATP-binding protein n=1 Tax=unclassified Frankia TaxID=2632575 RepID=UPI003A0FE3DE